MAKRRSLNDAILTRQQKSFLNEGESQPSKPRKRKTVKTAPVQHQKEEPPMATPALKENPPPAPIVLPITPVAASVPAPEETALHVRLDSGVGSTLLRASLERRLQGVVPHTQRDIVTEALVFWLRTHGYLK